MLGTNGCIDSSIKKSNDFKNFDEASEIEIEIEPETLFYNMLAADADYLYGLPQLENILGKEKMVEIAKKYKQSKTVRRESPKIGRNDPCPCGSGKKTAALPFFVRFFIRGLLRLSVESRGLCMGEGGK